MRSIRLAFAVVLVATAARAQGTISGCITDGSGSRMPGVTVTISGQGAQKQIVTLRDGCYSVTGLAPGSYSVRTTLPGFCPAGRDNIAVVAGRSSNVDFTLAVAALSDVLWVSVDARYYWRHADAVVYLRIAESERTRQMPAPTCGFIACTPYRAVVLSVGKRHREAGPSGPDFTFLQDYVESGERRYNAGDEFVAFLTWNPSWRTFVRLGGPGSLMPVHEWPRGDSVPAGSRLGRHEGGGVHCRATRARAGRAAVV